MGRKKIYEGVAAGKTKIVQQQQNLGQVYRVMNLANSIYIETKSFKA